MRRENPCCLVLSAPIIDPQRRRQDTPKFFERSLCFAQVVLQFLFPLVPLPPTPGNFQFSGVMLVPRMLLCGSRRLDQIPVRAANDTMLPRPSWRTVT